MKTWTTILAATLVFAAPALAQTPEDGRPYSYFEGDGIESAQPWSLYLTCLPVKGDSVKIVIEFGEGSKDGKTVGGKSDIAKLQIAHKIRNKIWYRSIQYPNNQAVYTILENKKYRWIGMKDADNKTMAGELTLTHGDFEADEKYDYSTLTWHYEEVLDDRGKLDKIRKIFKTDCLVESYQAYGDDIARRVR